MVSYIGLEDGILIRIMKLEDYEQANIFLGETFYKGAPLSGHCGEHLQKCYAKQIDEYHISMIEHGTCLLAVDENQGGRIMGLVLAGVMYASDLEKHRKEAAEMAENAYQRISLILSKAELEANIFEHFGVSKSLYFAMYTVDASMRGKGLGIRLVAAEMELSRSKGFPLMIAYCSSFYSTRQMETMGMKCVYELAYSDYKDDNGQVVFKPPAPHTHLRILAIKL